MNVEKRAKERGIQTRNSYEEYTKINFFFSFTFIGERMGGEK